MNAQERNVMEQALEALEDNQQLVADNECHAYVMEYNSIIEKCKESLAQPDPYKQGYADAMNWKVQNHLEHLPAAQPEQEPVAMRMPKVGDKVVCIADDSFGMVSYLTAGGSPEIRFDYGSHGTYLLPEFTKLFRYTTPPQRNAAEGKDTRRAWVGLTDEEKNQVAWSCGAMSADWLEFAKAIEAKLKERNNG